MTTSLSTGVSGVSWGLSSLGTDSINDLDGRAMISGTIKTNDGGNINFEACKTLGKGSYGIVCEVKLNSSDVDVSKLDVVVKYGNKRKALMSEGKILKELNGCPHIVKWIGHHFPVLQSEPVIILMENGGESLWDRMKKLPAQKYDERAARKIMKQILLSVKHCHNAGVVHCDIKPENFLINDSNEVKMCDFSISHKSEEATHRLSACWIDKNKIYNKDGKHNGTYKYVAPEVVLLKIFGKKADMFGVGATCIALLTGQHPNYSCAKYDKIKEAEKWDEEPFPNQLLIVNTAFEFDIDHIQCSNAAKWFAHSLTRVSPIFRWSHKQALNSNFILTVDSELIKTDEFNPNTIRNVQDYKRLCKKMRINMINIVEEARKYKKENILGTKHVSLKDPDMLKQLWGHVVNVCARSQNPLEPIPMTVTLQHVCVATSECMKASLIPTQTKYAEDKKSMKPSKIMEHYMIDVHKKEMLPWECALMCGKQHLGSRCPYYEERYPTYKEVILKFDADAKEETQEESQEETKDDEKKDDETKDDETTNVEENKTGETKEYNVSICLLEHRLRLKWDGTIDDIEYCWKNSEYNEMEPLEIMSIIDDPKQLDEMIDYLITNLTKNVSRTHLKSALLATSYKLEELFICRRKKKLQSKEHEWTILSWTAKEIIDGKHFMFKCVCCGRFDYWYCSKLFRCKLCKEEICLICKSYPGMNSVS